MLQQGKWAPTAEAIQGRAREARQWLKNRSEKEIVLVTHGGFLHYLTEDWTGSDKFQGTGWANIEFRSFTFAPDREDVDGADNASIVETSESRERRRWTEKPLSKTEQTQLMETTHKKWEQNGLQQIQAKV
ncbi:MAG: hypothetical protein M1827_007157 [Pycnora praestabilis]|nr:MAG: hypothetical protein M1827_007157 [Pycnora praestabilis]